MTLLLLAAACASGGAGSTPATAGTVQQSITVGATGSTAAITVTHDAETQSHLLTSAPARVWAVLPAVFDSLGIPAATVDPTSHTIGNTAFKAHGRLKGVPLSRYIDCGNSTQIGPNADSYDIMMSLVAQVRSAEGGASTLVISLEAAGKPATFSQDYSRCPTKGALETRLTETVQRLLTAQR